MRQQRTSCASGSAIFGQGIDPWLLARAFDQFTQEDRSLRHEREGLGIGLFTARRMVEHLDGELTIRNHPDGGVEAVVALPASRQP